MTLFIHYQIRNRTSDQEMTCQKVSWHNYQFGSQNCAKCYLLLCHNPILHQRHCNQLDDKGLWRVTMTRSSVLDYSNAFGCSVRFEHHCHRIERSVMLQVGLLTKSSSTMADQFRCQTRCSGVIEFHALPPYSRDIWAHNLQMYSRYGIVLRGSATLPSR